MTVGDIKIQKYQILFPKLTKELFETKEKVYTVAVLFIRLGELNKKCAYMKEIGKPTKNGTRITFATAETPEEYIEKVDEVIEEAKKNGLTFEVGGAE